MLCPKDNVVCDPVQYKDVHIELCPKCLGVWLERSEVRKIVEYFTYGDHTKVENLIKNWREVDHPGTVPKDFWVEDTLICPRDHVAMKKHYFAGTTIGIDHCLTCEGFWLDEGELYAIAKNVAPNPTLERAWQSVLRDQKEWEVKQRELERLIAQSMLWVAGPAYGVTAVGSFMLKFLIDFVHRSNK